MNELVNRARSAMNLILAASLVLAWAVAVPPTDPTQIAIKLIRTAYDLIDPRVSEIKDSDGTVHVYTVQKASKEELESLETMLTAIRIEEKDLDGVDIATIEKLEVDVLTRPNLSGGYFKLAFEDFEKQWRGLDIFPTSTMTIHDLIAIEAYRSLRSQLIELQRRADDNANQTIRDLITIAKREVRLPGMNQTIAADKAVILISLGLLGPFLYLYSTCLTMRQVCDAPRQGGNDWIFFHAGWKGWLGPIVGTIWLSLPCIVIGISALVNNPPKFRVLVDIPGTASSTPLLYISLLTMATIFAVYSAWMAHFKRQKIVLSEERLRSEQHDNVQETLKFTFSDPDGVRTLMAEQLKIVIADIKQQSQGLVDKLTTLEADVAILKTKSDDPSAKQAE